MARIRGQQDVVSGLMFVAIGVVFAASAWSGLKIGTAARMGPGYIPFYSALILTGLGLLSILRGFLRSGLEMPALKGRPLAVIMLSVIVFALTVRPLGLGLSILATVAISRMAAARLPWGSTILLALGVAAFCALLFLWGFGLPLPLLPAVF